MAEVINFVCSNIIISFYLSISFYSLSIYFYTKKFNSILIRLIFSILNFCFFCQYLFSGIIFWFIGKNFNDAVLYHIKFGFSGAGLGEYWLLILISILLIILFLFLSLWFYFMKNEKLFPNKNKNFPLCILFLLLAITFSPIVFGIYETNYKHKYKKATANFYDYYKKPELKKNEITKNLVYIYAEGLEETYFNENIFPNLTENLNKIKSKSTYFTNLNEIKGANCTIGGIVSSQCGFPLFNPSGDYNKTDNFKQYLPSAICLGDLLSAENYYLSYFGGASLEFAGKGNFFKTHSFDEVKGRDELKNNLKNANYLSPWGLYDDTLMELAYNNFLKLSKEKENYAMFLLTLDTHHPNGHKSEICKDIFYQDGKNEILNAVKCSDFIISNFVNKILSSPYASSTIIAISSDHLAHRNTASYILEKNERKNLFMIIDPEKKTKKVINEQGSTLDIFTTLLPSLGYEAKIGLGRNLNDPFVKKDDIRTIHANASLWKNEIINFWNFPIIKEKVELNISKNTVLIDNNSYSLPVFIKLDKNMQTTMYFDNNSNIELFNVKKNEPFLFIGTLEGKGENYYLLAGIGDKILKKQNLNEVFTFNTDELKSIFSF